MLLPVIWLVFTFAVAVCSAPTDGDDHTHQGPKDRKCSNLRVRYEWRELRSEDKADYIRGVKCLQKLPAKNKIRPSVRSRYDEFLITHIDLTDDVHVVAQFLPWHRQYIFLQETALRKECGYRGPLPYWDSSIDADSKKPMIQSPVFDPKTGFGGDGIAGTYTIPPDPLGISAVDQGAYSKGCVYSGPFKDYISPLGPGKLATSHCLVRSINETYRHYLTSPAIRSLMSQPDYSSFRIELEGVPSTSGRRVHDAGHLIIGGDMGNPYSSPSDPLFYLHHANLDRLWWEWQQSNPISRLFEISGRALAIPPYTNITLEFPLVFNSLAPPVPVRSVMDIHSEPLCYTYL